MDVKTIGVGARLLPRWSQQEWMSNAACRGQTPLFFAPNAERPQARERREARARSVCDQCPVGLACRTYARDHNELGFWGGESENDRERASYALADQAV